MSAEIDENVYSNFKNYAVKFWEKKTLNLQIFLLQENAIFFVRYSGAYSGGRWGAPPPPPHL